MTDDHDARDPIRAAFLDYQRAPRDVVPHTAAAADDLAALADTDQTVTYYEFTDHGVTRHVDQIAITRPIGAPEHD